MAGSLPLLGGELKTGEHLAIGYFAQHQLDSLDPQASPLLHLARLAPDEREQVLRNFLGGFDFKGDRIEEPARAGCERRVEAPLKHGTERRAFLHREG